MALIIKEIKLEVSKPNLIQAIVAKQNDCNSRFLKVSLWDEGVVIPLKTSSTVTINAERKDGFSGSWPGEVNDDDTATVPLHSDILALEGNVNCDVSIIDVEGRKLTTTTFVVKVEKAACGSDDIIDNPQYDVLTNLINEVNAQGDVAKNTFASAIKGTASGNPIRLNDVSPLAHEMSVGVKSRNILPIVPYDGSKTVSGITFTLNDDNSLHIKGTATAATNFSYVSENVGQRKPIKKGTYTISGANGLVLGGNLGRITIGITGVTEYYAYNNTPTTFTIASDTTMYFKVSIFQGATVDTTVYPMLELGNTASAYSKPVDVNGASVKKFGKNLWRFEDLRKTGGADLTKTDTGLISKGGVGTTFVSSNIWLVPISCLDGMDLTISCDVVPSGNNKPRLGLNYVGENGTVTASIKETGTLGMNASIPLKVDSTKASGGKYIQFRFCSNVSSTTEGLTSDDIATWSNFQIEIGNKTAYEPYKCEPHTADANGVVSGIIGNGEDVTLMGDGVTITAEYNVDTKKYIDKKFDELAAMLVSE